MIVIAKVTTNGGVSIPKDIRRHLGIKKGDYIRFHLDEDSKRVEFEKALFK